jgi:hypothetical protein
MRLYTVREFMCIVCDENNSEIRADKTKHNYFHISLRECRTKLKYINTGG